MFAFIHIHKTGGTTVQWLLRSSFGMRYCEVEPLTIGSTYRQTPWLAPTTVADLGYLDAMYPRLDGIGGHHVQPHQNIHEKYPSIQYFAFMRDPVKMRASMYQHGVEALGETDCVFEEWLQEEQSRNRQTKMIAGTPDVEKAIEIIHRHNIFVGLTDKFNESLLLLKSLMLPSLQIHYKRMNVASGDTVAKRILASARHRKMLEEGNEADIALFQYVADELYPQFQRDYGDSLATDTALFEAELQRFQQRTVSLSFMNKPRLFRLLLLWDMDPFNGRNVALSLLKKYLLYRPRMRLNRIGLSS